MNAYTEGLTPQQDAAILALLSEPTIAKAAEKAQVGERTLYRWLDDEAFARAYRRARREAFSQAITMTQRYAPMAIQQLARVMQDPATASAAKVSAAVAILKFSRESIELDDIASRLEALERAAKAEREDGPGTLKYG